MHKVIKYIGYLNLLYLNLMLSLRIVGWNRASFAKNIRDGKSKSPDLHVIYLISVYHEIINTVAEETGHEQ